MDLRHMGQCFHAVHPKEVMILLQSLRYCLPEFGALKLGHSIGLERKESL
jgi:hypothetical protein